MMEQTKEEVPSMQLPSVKSLQKAFPYIKKREARQIREILKKYYDHPDGAMYRIDRSRILKTRGLFYTKSFKDNEDNRYGILIFLTYEDLGPTTIIYDYEQRNYQIGTWGDIVFSQPGRFKIFPD